MHSNDSIGWSKVQRQALRELEWEIKLIEIEIEAENVMLKRINDQYIHATCKIRTEYFPMLNTKKSTHFVYGVHG